MIARAATAAKKDATVIIAVPTGIKSFSTCRRPDPWQPQKHLTSMKARTFAADQARLRRHRAANA